MAGHQLFTLKSTRLARISLNLNRFRPLTEHEMKNKHAVALGKKGGKVGGLSKSPAKKAASIANLAKAKKRKEASA